MMSRVMEEIDARCWQRKSGVTASDNISVGNGGSWYGWDFSPHNFDRDTGKQDNRSHEDYTVRVAVTLVGLTQKPSFFSFFALFFLFQRSFLGEFGTRSFGDVTTSRDRQSDRSRSSDPTATQPDMSVTRGRRMPRVTSPKMAPTSSLFASLLPRMNSVPVGSGYIWQVRLFFPSRFYSFVLFFTENVISLSLLLIRPFIHRGC